MKIFLTYWLAGCFVIGTGVAFLTRECPDQKMKPGQVAEMIATWPAIVLTSIINRNMPSTRSCD